MLLKTPVIFVPLTLSLLLSAACSDEIDPGGGFGGGVAGGGQSDGGGPVGGSTASADGAAAFCEQVIARDEACAVEAPTTGECLGDELTVCLFGGIRDGVREAIIECVLERPCDAADDLETCVYTPGEADPVPGQIEFRTECLETQQTCGTFSDDNCIINFFDTPAYEILSACLQESCDAVGACLSAQAAALCAG